MRAARSWTPFIHITTAMTSIVIRALLYALAALDPTVPLLLAPTSSLPLVLALATKLQLLRRSSQGAFT